MGDQIPWDEEEFGLSLLQRRVERVEVNDTAEADQVPMVPYPKEYCTHCGEMAFCHHAFNPGCGGHATGGVASFNNHVKAHGCMSTPTLTVPRSYMRDINHLKYYPGGRNLLRDMLVAGFDAQMRNGDHGPVWQCIHGPKRVSVRWLHLHTFCKEGKVDNLPTRTDYCAVMSNRFDADRIAASWVN